MILPDSHPGPTYDLVCSLVRARMEIESAPPSAIPTQLREAIVRDLKSHTAALIQYAKTTP